MKVPLQYTPGREIVIAESRRGMVRSLFFSLAAVGMGVGGLLVALGVMGHETLLNRFFMLIFGTFFAGGGTFLFFQSLFRLFGKPRAIFTIRHDALQIRNFTVSKAFITSVCVYTIGKTKFVGIDLREGYIIPIKERLSRFGSLCFCFNESLGIPTLTLDLRFTSYTSEEVCAVLAQWLQS